MTKKTILLIDDDPLFLMLTRRLLEKEDYLERIDTLTALDEVQAYFGQREKEHTSYPDAIFIDIDMPEINGLELAEQLYHDYIKKKADETKIFILSSSISQRDRQTAEGLQAVADYMEKPLSANMLRQALEISQKKKQETESKAR